MFALLWGFIGCTHPPKSAESQPPHPPPAVVESAPESIGEIQAERILPPPPPPPKPRPQPYVHKVRYSGETLISIAKWYTGSRNNWTVIAKANPHLVNPNRILIGDTILIPENLLKRRDPMPLSFLNTSSRKKSAQTLPPKQQSVESYAIELFNPEITEQPPTESDTIPLFEPIE
jgi:hypothetical protein